MLQMILIINRLSLFLGDRRFIEEKSYWLHVQSDKFMWRRDKCICQLLNEKQEKNMNLF